MTKNAAVCEIHALKVARIIATRADFQLHRPRKIVGIPRIGSKAVAIFELTIDMQNRQTIFPLHHFSIEQSPSFLVLPLFLLHDHHNLSPYFL